MTCKSQFSTFILGIPGELIINLGGKCHYLLRELSAPMASFLQPVFFVFLFVCFTREMSIVYLHIFICMS